jgi:hypothetical protein
MQRISSATVDYSPTLQPCRQSERLSQSVRLRRVRVGFQASGDGGEANRGPNRTLHCSCYPLSTPTRPQLHTELHSTVDFSAYLSLPQVLRTTANVPRIHTSISPNIPPSRLKPNADPKRRPVHSILAMPLCGGSKSVQRKLVLLYVHLFANIIENLEEETQDRA